MFQRACVTGRKFRIPGKGKPGRNGGKKSAICTVQINVAEDPKFSLRKRDIIMDLPITVGQAVAGAKVTAQDIDGNEVTFKVPAGSSSGTEVRISGRGVANRQGDGDLIGRVQIRIARQAEPESQACGKGIRQGVRRFR